MTREARDRQHKSEMGRIFASVAAGMFVKASIGVGSIYAVIEGYQWISTVFDPVARAMGGK